MTTDPRYHSLASVLSNEALEYCFRLLAESDVAFTLSRPRSSKWGDYRFGRSIQPAITVNRNLEPPLFLMTFLHEFAHHQTIRDYGRKVPPHGVEWKMNFRSLMLPFLNEESLGKTLFPLIAGHMQNPRANISADQALYRYVLDQRNEEGTAIRTLSIGQRFYFRNEEYEVEQPLRKRIRVIRTRDQRRYIFQPLVRVYVGEPQ